MCGSTRCREACRLQQARQPGGATRPPLACVSSANASTPASSSAKQQGSTRAARCPDASLGPSHRMPAWERCVARGVAQVRREQGAPGAEGRGAGLAAILHASQQTLDQPAYLRGLASRPPAAHTRPAAAGARPPPPAPAAAAPPSAACPARCAAPAPEAPRQPPRWRPRALPPGQPPAQRPPRRARCPRPQSRPRCCRRARAAPAAASLRLRYRRRTPAVPVRLAPAHRAAARSSPP